MNSMKGLIAYLAAAAVLISLAMPATFAQQMIYDDWAAVQSLTPSDEIIITLKTDKEVKGKFLDAGASEVSIERKGKRESVAKDTIAQIHLRKRKAAKGKWALIGAGMGAATGFGIGQSKNGAHVDDGEIYPVVGTLIGTGIGAATGFFIGQSQRKRELIYRGR